MLSTPILKRIFPGARADICAELVARADEIAAATNGHRLCLAHFLAQIGTETLGLARLEENLAYSAARLVAVWPSRFHSVAEAAPYAHNPEALANKVYGGRLGNTEPGDGWRYRGRSLIQTTGRANYRAVGHEADPESLGEPRPALTAALRFWTDHRLNDFAARDQLTALRKAVNGGLNGLADARTYLARAKAALP